MLERITSLSPEVLLIAASTVSFLLGLVVFRVYRLGRDDSAQQEVTATQSNPQLLALNRVQQVARIGSWVWERESERMDWSDEMYPIQGLESMHTVAGRDALLAQAHPEDQLRVAAALERLLYKGQAFELEYRLVAPDGQTRYMAMQGALSDDENRAVGTLQDITERDRMERFMSGLADEVMPRKGEDSFDAVANFLAKTLHCSGVLIGLLDSNDRGQVNTLSAYRNGEKLKNFSYLPDHGPCSKVLDREGVFYKENADGAFPQAELFGHIPASSYAGLPLYDNGGECIGIVALLDEKPMPRQDAIRPLLQVAAGVIGSEIQRQNLEQQLQLTASVFENTQEGILITDVDLKIVTVNQGFCEITGYSRDEVIGMEPGDFFVPEKHDDHFFDMMWWLISRNGTWHGELWNRRKCGEVFPCLQSIESVVDDDGNVVRYISVFSDITDQKRTEEKIQYLAHYDTLTGLPNRVLFNDRLNHAIARASRLNIKLGLLFIDLDRFKYVNDTLGHQQGDMLLTKVADRLNNCVRESDTVARLGGDEFTVILEDVERPDLMASVAEKILASLSAPVELDGHQVVVGCSLGLSLYPTDGGCSEQLIKHADTAMYSAKESGRNTYAFYCPELSRTSYEHFRLENELRHAIEHQHLMLYYQPQQPVAGGRVEAVEALVRWQPPGGEMITPDRFIPLAEETGLIVEMGAWVLNSACAQARQWNKDGLDVRVAVNISGVQIMRSDFVSQVKRALDASGLEPRQLELEVTESYVMEHIDAVIETLSRVKALGVRVSIDDFGTGYSSLSYLKRLPIDALKIDRSFIAGIPDDSEDQMIAGAIIAMAQSLNLSVVAEGVETHAQLNYLEERGCELAQGYFNAQPMPAAGLERFLTGKQRELYAIS